MENDEDNHEEDNDDDDDDDDDIYFEGTLFFSEGPVFLCIIPALSGLV